VPDIEPVTVAVAWAKTTSMLSAAGVKAGDMLKTERFDVSPT
jgi:hypothetical protein